MDTITDGRAERGFSIKLDFTDEEIRNAYLIWSRKRSSRDPGGTVVLVVMGALVAVACALVAIAAGVVTAPHSAPIVILAFAAFWLGLWSPSLRAGTGKRLRRTLSRRREIWNGATLRVMPGGLFMRSKGVRIFCTRSEFVAETIEGGMVILWTNAESGIAIPARLLTLEQQAALMAWRQGSV